MSSDLSSIASRIDLVLRGRSGTTWARWVGLSRGAVDRMRAGSLPDPVKLSGAIRAENLSLSWLVEGVGAPYTVAACASIADADECIAMAMDDEESLQAMIVRSAGTSQLVVLHQPAQVDTSLPATVDYTAVTVLVGKVTDTLLRSNYLARTREVFLPPDDWRRLATGHMAASELFGWPGDPGGIASGSKALTQPLRLVVNEPEQRYSRKSNPGAIDHPTEVDVDELATLLSAMDPSQRAAIIQLIRTLSAA